MHLGLFFLRAAVFGVVPVEDADWTPCSARWCVGVWGLLMGGLVGFATRRSWIV